MRREKVFNRSLLILAIMSIMLFAMTITASAASGRAVTNLQRQMIPRQVSQFSGAVIMERNT